MNDLISVIIPVYNTEKYLIHCLDSVITQTYKQLEIIIINDGSTDGSGRICDEYAQKDVRIKVIHKSNGGLSSARNAGIDSANGDRLLFIDSDDFVASNHISYLNQMYKEYSVQVVSTPLIKRYSNGKLSSPNCFKHFVTNGLEAKAIALRGYYSGVSSSGKLFDARLFRDIKYPEGEIYEDLKIIPHILKKADNVLFSDFATYYYNQHSTSIMHSNYNLHAEGMVSFYNVLICKAETKEIRNAAIFRMEMNVKEHCWRIKLGKNKKDIKLFIQVLKKYKNEFMNDTLNSRKEKIKYMFLSSNVMLFYFFCIMQHVKFWIKET